MNRLNASYARPWSKFFGLSLIGICLLWINSSSAQQYHNSTVTAIYANSPDRDSVQSVLEEMNKEYPDLVGFLLETQRYYLVYPRREAVPEAMMIEIQDAFFADIKDYCQEYSRKYLTDWRALASKAARESFWGTSYLCNRTFNYFGIRHKAKPWICESFGICESFVRNDPRPAAFAVFSDFETSLWVFIHTIYSDHFLERLPDQGKRVADAIAFERMNGIRYWEKTPYGISYGSSIPGFPYTANELIHTWSGHEINNLCVDCSRQSDRRWVHKLILADVRSRK